MPQDIKLCKDCVFHWVGETSIHFCNREASQHPVTGEWMWGKLFLCDQEREVVPYESITVAISEFETVKYGAPRRPHKICGARAKYWQDASKKTRADLNKK